MKLELIAIKINGNNYNMKIKFSGLYFRKIFFRLDKFKERLSGPLTGREKTFLQKDSRRLDAKILSKTIILTSLSSSSKVNSFFLTCFNWLRKLNSAAFFCSLANLFSYLDTFFRVGFMLKGTREIN